ncbi:hypothetical protein WJX82_011399 [Trebouxia sp. C0006]
MTAASEEEWMDSSALTDDMIRSSWSPATKEAERARRKSIANLQSRLSSKAEVQELDTQSHAGVPQQPQQEAKKSRFSLSFLRGSLLSPKGGGSGSMFSSTERKASFQSAVTADSPSSATDSPNRRNSVGDSAASAQHWSPLGHGASAFSSAQAAHADDEADAVSLKESHDNSQEQHGARSPLRALSSNSPTRLRPANSGSLSDAASSKRRQPLLHAPHPPQDTGQAISGSLDDNDDSFAPTMVLGPAASARHSPLPANALVTYSSDEDDWHNAVDTTERVDLGQANLPSSQLDNTDAASFASGFSDASTADAAGSVYDLGQRSPAALFMSPSASFGDTDAAGGYEPTMSPGAFQAAMAAGILAAQGSAPNSNQQAAYASLDTPQNSGTAAAALVMATEPVAGSRVRPVETQEGPFTPSSIASNSVASSKPNLAAGFDSAAVSRQHASDPATPVSKATLIADSAVSKTYADAGSPAAESTNAVHNSISPTPEAASQASAEAEANDVPQSGQKPLRDDGTLQSQRPAAAAASDADSTGTAAADVASAANSEPASTQMAEIAEVSDQAQTSAMGTELTSVEQPADAQLSSATSAGPAVVTAVTSPELSASPADERYGKSLFSAVSKRPAEAGLEGEPTSKTPRGSSAVSPSPQKAHSESSQVAETLSAAVCSQAARGGLAAEDNEAGRAATAIEYETEHVDTVESEAEHVDTVEVVHDLVQELLEAVARHGTPHKVDAARTLSQAFSGGLPSPACAISISAAPAAISQMDLSASSATLTQPAASSASAGAMPPAIAAQHAHLGSDADSHPEPSPNYRMDHLLADNLHSRMHASHDFGPMSLVSAMSNDENLTPAASTDFSQAARLVAERDGAVQAAEQEAEAAPAVDTGSHRTQHSTPPRLPFWETQMTPHGHHSASRLDPPSTQHSSAVPTVTPSTEVNAVGQPVVAQDATAVAVVHDVAQRLAAAQATPAVADGAAVQGVAPGSGGGASDADIVTPPGGFQTGQVWENNVFSPEMPAERPRSAIAMGSFRRLSNSPNMGQSQSAAPGLRPGPSRTVSLRIQVPNDPSRPDSQSQGAHPSSVSGSITSQSQQQSSVATTVLLADTRGLSVEQNSVSASGTTVCPTIQVNPAGTSSPEFDAAFANEAEAMFGFGVPSGHADSMCQLQRRLRLSDVGLQHSPAAQMLLEDASTIKKLEEEVACLQAINSELLKDKEEALPLLDAYRLSISQLQERQSLDSVHSKTTINRLETQAAKLQAERDSVQHQFKQLYHDKYQPLKAHHQAALDSNQQVQEQQQQTVEKLRTQLATADLKVRKAGLDIQSLTQQLQQSQEDIQAQRGVIAEKEAAVEAAQAAEQQVRKQLTSTSTSTEALKEAQAESDSLRQQLEESVRKYSTVKQARERAMTEVYAKEEELCELQVKLGDRDTALKAYKTENSRFADMKDNFKADIAALQQQVSEKEEEKATLLTMCNELMNKLEREGISL